MDPLTGEGIRLAIQSGRFAASAIIETSEVSNISEDKGKDKERGNGKRQEEAPGRLYEEKVKRHVSPSLTFSLILATIFYKVPAWCFSLGACNPIATHAFVHLISGRISHFSLAMFLCMTLPTCLLVEFFSLLISLLFCSVTWMRRRVRNYIYSILAPLLLWPFVILHGILGFILSRAFF